MPNKLLTVDEAEKQMTADWMAIVNAGRKHPLNKSDAIALFGVAFGVLDVPAAEVSELLADKPRSL